VYLVAGVYPVSFMYFAPCQFVLCGERTCWLLNSY
jgi:hypothetical protein